MQRAIVRSFCKKRYIQPLLTCTRNTSDWKEECATESEAIVKADRHHQQSIQELQKHTIHRIKTKYYIVPEYITTSES